MKPSTFQAGHDLIASIAIALGVIFICGFLYIAAIFICWVSENDKIIDQLCGILAVFIPLPGLAVGYFEFNRRLNCRRYQKVLRKINPKLALKHSQTITSEER